MRRSITPIRKGNKIMDTNPRDIIMEKVVMIGAGITGLVCAKELLEKMEENIKIIEEKSIFFNEQEKEDVLNVYRKGITVLSLRLNEKITFR